MSTVMIPEIFDVEINGSEYTFEFTRKAIKDADQMGVMDVTSTLKRAEIIFYAGLQKHKPDITPNLARKILYSAIGEGDAAGEYKLADFNPIFDEFSRWAMEVFAGTGEKKIVSRRNQAN